MLLNELGRHKRLMSVFIFAFIGLPMLFFIQGSASVADLFRGGPQQVPVAMVGKTPVTSEEFAHRYMAVQEQRSQFGQPATAKELVADGTVDAIMEVLQQEAMITEETKAQPIKPGQDYLVEQLRKDPSFKNEKGEFDAGLYNRWVEGNNRGGANWDAVYESIADQVNRQKYLELIGAATRVPESEVRRQFYDRNTKMKVKAAAVSPKVELTEEQIRAYYDANLAEFMTPEERVAEYIAISLAAPVPPLAQELVDRARGGEDFEALVRKYSQGIDADKGGEMDWISESPALRGHEKPLFEMKVGEVRGPIESFIGLHIYKLEETREENGVRQVRARQIVLRPELSAEERTARTDKAKALAERAKKENLNIAALAAAEGLESHKTGRFGTRSAEIEGIDEADMLVFRTTLLRLDPGTVSDVIETAKNLYIAENVEIIPPAQRTFETAHDDVKQSAVGQSKQAPEYRKKVIEYVAKIQQQCKSLDDMKTKFPELDFELKQTDSFGLTDMLFQQGLFMEGRTLLERLVNKNPGEFGGPIMDMLQTPYFVEVVERTVPEGEKWEAQYATEKESVRKDLYRMHRQQLQADYLQYLHTQYIQKALVQQDDEEIYRLLRIDEPGTAAAAKPAPETSTPANEAPPVPDVENPIIENTAPPPPAGSEAPASTPAPESPAPEAAPATQP